MTFIVADDKNSKFEKENADLDTKITMLNSQIVLLENSKRRSEDSCSRLEKKVEELQQQSYKK